MSREPGANVCNGCVVQLSGVDDEFGFWFLERGDGWTWRGVGAVIVEQMGLLSFVGMMEGRYRVKQHVRWRINVFSGDSW